MSTIASEVERGVLAIPGVRALYRTGPAVANLIGAAAAAIVHAVRESVAALLVSLDQPAPFVQVTVVHIAEVHLHGDVPSLE